MGMGSAPCHGYVVEATKENMVKVGWSESKLIEFAKTLNDSDIADFDEAMAEIAMDYTSLEIYVYGDGVEVEVMLYDRENGDRYDDLEDGKVYLSFDEDVLYTRSVTPIGEILKCNKMFPEEKQWTNFG